MKYAFYIPSSSFCFLDMFTLYHLLVAICFSLFLVDMWEIIEKENRGDTTKNRTKGRFGGPQHGKNGVFLM